MCQEQLLWWRCRHYYVDLIDCAEKCGIRQLLPVHYYNTDCCSACCRKEAKKKQDDIAAFERDNRIRVEDSGAEISLGTSRGWDPKVHSTHSGLKISLGMNLKMHLEQCCKEHLKGNMLSNRRRKAMGWAPYLPDSVELPPYQQRNDQLPRILKEWKDSEVRKTEEADFWSASSGLGGEPKVAPKIQKRHQPRASGSGRYERQQQRQVDDARDRRAAEDRRHNEEAELARHLCPAFDEPVLLGQRPRDGYEAVRPSPNHSRQPSSEPRAPRDLPPVQTSRLQEEEDEEYLIQSLRYQTPRLDPSNQYNIRFMVDNLRQLARHLQNAQFFGPDADYHPLEYVVRMSNMNALFNESAALQRRLDFLRQQQQLLIAAYDDLEDLRRLNDLLIFEHIDRLVHWAMDAGEEAQATMSVYESDAGLLRDALWERKFALQQSFLSHAQGARSGPQDSPDQAAMSEGYRAPTPPGGRRQRSRDPNERAQSPRSQAPDARGPPTSTSRSRSREPPLQSQGGSAQSYNPSTAPVRRSGLSQVDTVAESIETNQRPTGDGTAEDYLRARAERDRQRIQADEERAASRRGTPQSGSDATTSRPRKKGKATAGK